MIGFQEDPEKQPAAPDRYVSTEAIRASIFAAARLGNLTDGVDFRRVTPKVQQAVRLARTILDEVLRGR